MKFPWQRPKDPVVANYRDGCRRLPRGRDVITGHSFLVVDAETTGFDVSKDRLLSLACVEVAEREICVETMQEWLVYQPDIQRTDAVGVHGILPSETAQGRPEKEVLSEFLPSLSCAVLVGHHIGFDAKMLGHAAHKHYRLRLKNPMVDTALFAMQELEPFKRSGYPNQRPPSLDEVCSHLGIQTLDRHTAAGDAFTTAELFLLLTARLRQRLGRPPKLRDMPLARM